MNKRFELSLSKIIRNHKIGFYSLDVYFPCLILNKDTHSSSINFYAWSDFWIYKSNNSLTFSLRIFGFGFKLHHRNKQGEYGNI